MASEAAGNGPATTSGDGVLKVTRVVRGTLAGVALFTFAGCGGGSDSSAGVELASIDSTPNTSDKAGDTAAEQPDPAVDPDEALARFEACMKEQGVNISLAGSGAEVPTDDLAESPQGPPSREAFEAAQAECESIMDDAFGSFDLSPEQEAEQADQLLALQRCLADQGFDVDLSGGSFSIEQSDDMEAFDDALQTCSQDAGLNGEGEPGS